MPHLRQRHPSTRLRTLAAWKGAGRHGQGGGRPLSTVATHLRFHVMTVAPSTARPTGMFLELWRVGLERYDELKGLDWSWLSMDGAMTKSPLGGGRPTGPNPTDRGKGGVKRSLLTEAQGIPVGLAVDGANRHDMKLVRATVDSLPVPRPAPSPDQPQGMCLDKGYDFDEVRRTLDEFGFTAHMGVHMLGDQRCQASQSSSEIWNAPVVGLVLVAGPARFGRGGFRRPGPLW